MDEMTPPSGIEGATGSPVLGEVGGPGAADGGTGERGASEPEAGGLDADREWPKLEYRSRAAERSRSGPLGWLRGRKRDSQS